MSLRQVRRRTLGNVQRAPYPRPDGARRFGWEIGAPGAGQASASSMVSGRTTEATLAGDENENGIAHVVCPAAFANVRHCLFDAYSTTFPDRI